MRIVVVGAGVLGSTIAVHLAETGSEVTVVERRWAGAGTSSTSYAWVNANGKEPESYFELNRRGLEAHAALARDGADWFCGNGHVEIAVDDAHSQHLHARVDRLQARNYGLRWLTEQQAVDLYPDLLVPKGHQAIAHFLPEGHVFPALYLAHMLGRARRAGVDLREHTTVTGFAPSGSGATVQLEGGEHLHADHVVVAAGRWTQHVAALAGGSVPLVDYATPGDITVGYLWETSPTPTRLPGLLTCPWINARPDGGGRLLLQALDLDVTASPATAVEVDGPVAQEMIRRLQEVLLGTAGVQLRRGVVGQRVMPADGRTIVGPVPEVPWLYAVATHSGVTLAPYLGRVIAEEVLGESHDLLDSFRPTRFSDGSELPALSQPRKPGEQ